MPKNINTTQPPIPLYILYLLLAAAGILVYLNALRGQFIWDDYALVAENTYIKNWHFIHNIFSADIGKGYGIAYGYYRPLLLLTHVLEYHAWQLHVIGYHAVNIGLHICVSWALFYLMRMLLIHETAAFFAALLFIVHPVHTESIAYISGRAEPLAGLFILLTLIFYISAIRARDTAPNPDTPYLPPRIRFFFFASASFALALLSKENSLITPLVLLGYHIAYKKRLCVLPLLAMSGIVGIYTLIRSHVLMGKPLVSVSWYELGTRLPAFFAAITEYARLLFAPLNLRMEYGEYLQFGYTDPRVILGILLALILCAFIIKKRHNSPAMFSCAFSCIAFLPVSNLLHPMAFFIAEHYLYLPSMGICMLLAACISKITPQKKYYLAYSMLSILIIIYGYVTITQNNYWKDYASFSLRTLRHTPKSLRILNNLSVYYNTIDKKQEAIRINKHILRLYPHNAIAYCNLSDIYLSLGKKETAVQLLKKALQTHTTGTRASLRLADIYRDTGKYRDAICLYRKTLRDAPYDMRAYNNLGTVYMLLNKPIQAMQIFTRALDAGIYNSPEIYHNIGLLCLDRGKTKEGIRMIEHALTLQPRYGQALSVLALIYCQQHNMKKSQEYYQKMLSAGYTATPEITACIQKHIRRRP